MRLITRFYMELHEFNYWIVHGAVRVQLLDFTWSCMRLITRLYIEQYEINY